MPGCHSGEERVAEVTVTQEIMPHPPRVGSARISVELSDALKGPVSHASIIVEADMSHPGMSPVFSEAEEAAPGHYRAQVAFDMAGDWVVLLHIRLADGRRIERQIDVRAVKPN